MSVGEPDVAWRGACGWGAAYRALCGASHRVCRALRRVHTKWVAVCDLGLSAVFIYELDTVNGALIGAADNPRHMRCERLAPSV